MAYFRPKALLPKLRVPYRHVVRLEAAGSVEKRKCALLLVAQVAVLHALLVGQRVAHLFKLSDFSNGQKRVAKPPTKYSESSSSSPCASALKMAKA